MLPVFELVIYSSSKQVLLTLREKCLCSDSSSNDGGATAMQTLLTLVRTTSDDSFPHKVASILPEVCAKQLHLALNTASSFATIVSNEVYVERLGLGEVQSGSFCL